jgi:hypothetical protein
MRTSIVVALAATLPLALCVPVLKAQGPNPNAAKEASQMSESGPAVVGGSGATAGPNYKNQAITPMPGLRQQEELSERRPTLPPPEVRPVTNHPSPLKR